VRRTARSSKPAPSSPVRSTPAVRSPPPVTTHLVEPRRLRGRGGRRSASAEHRCRNAATQLEAFAQRLSAEPQAPGTLKPTGIAERTSFGQHATARPRQANCFSSTDQALARMSRRQARLLANRRALPAALAAAGRTNKLRNLARAVEAAPPACALGSQLTIRSKTSWGAHGWSRTPGHDRPRRADPAPAAAADHRPPHISRAPLDAAAPQALALSRRLHRSAHQDPSAHRHCLTPHASARRRPA
jgi:hypothetical protein